MGSLLNKDKLVHNIEQRASKIKTDIVHLGFSIERTKDIALKSILEKSFVLTSYGYLEGFVKHSLNEYLNFLYQYMESNPKAKLKNNLYYFYKFSQLCKQKGSFKTDIVHHFNKFLQKDILKKVKKVDIVDFSIQVNNNLTYDVFILLLHFFSLDLSRYENFQSLPHTELLTETILNSFVADRNALAHGELACLTGSFSMSYDYIVYKNLVSHLVNTLQQEISDTLIYDKFLV